MFRRCKALLRCLGAALIAFAGSVAIHARPWIDMGPKDDFAFDQPAAQFELFEQLSGGGRGASLGPDGGSIFFAAFCPDGTRLATAGKGDFTVRLWDLPPICHVQKP